MVVSTTNEHAEKQRSVTYSYFKQGTTLQCMGRQSVVVKIS
jgi:hypothetical protein